MKIEQLSKEVTKVVSDIQEAIGANRLTLPHKTGGYKAFFILHSVKGAAVLGFERGHGMVFKILGMSPEGAPVLSPPVFLRVSKIAVGLQIGYNTVNSLVLLPDDGQLEALASHSEIIMDFDISGLPRHPDTLSTETTVHRTSMGVIEEGVHITPTILSVSDSLMLLDISLYGGKLCVDKELMAHVYGDSYGNAMDVLHGKVELPESLGPVVATVKAGLSDLVASHPAREA